MTNTPPLPQQPQIIIQKSSSTGCWIAALVAIGFCVLIVGGCGIVGLLGIGSLTKEMNAASQRKADAIKDLEIIDFQWGKEGFGSIMEASFTIKNSGTTDVKDIEIECTHFAPSGTKIDSNTRTIYEVIKAGESRNFSKFNMGFIHSQADKSFASIKSAVTAGRENIKVELVDVHAVADEELKKLTEERANKDKQKAEQEAIAAQVKLAQEALDEKEAMLKKAAQSAQTLARIPAGSFSMGDFFGEGASTERPVRQVTVSAFYLGKTEVTKQQWDEVKDWASGHGYTDLSAGDGKAANHPVTGVNWWDAVKWCNARSELEGLVPCYSVGGSTMRVGTEVPEVNWSAKGYRLPTEAEWEKAARGGLNGKRFPWGDTISHSQANYNSSSSYAYDVSPTRGNHSSYGGGTSPVGSFAANAYGLQDMAGNVWEWCWDWYGTYASVAQSDPRGEAAGSARVLRSGGWSGGARDCRAADRYGYGPGGQGYYLGFRVLRSSVP